MISYLDAYDLLSDEGVFLDQSERDGFEAGYKWYEIDTGDVLTPGVKIRDFVSENEDDTEVSKIEVGIVWTLKKGATKENHAIFKKTMGARGDTAGIYGSDEG